MTLYRPAKAFSGLALLAGLAACSGSSDDPVTFTSLDADRTEIMGELAASTPTATMPTSGGATYEGVSAFKTGSAATAAADMDFLATTVLSADFGANEINADFYEFRDPAGNELVGNFKVEDGTITGNTLTGDVNGSYAQNGNVGTLDGTLNGTFHGPDAELITGDVTGNVLYTDGSTRPMFGDVSLREE